MTPDQPQGIGQRIEEARKEEGLTQAQLAEKLGFASATAVFLIESEKRKIKLDLLQKIAAVLHREIDFFLGHSKPTDYKQALRATAGLTPNDVKQVETFIEFLRSKNVGKLGGK